MLKTTLLAVLLTLILPVAALAKGEGVGLWMEGKVSDVKTEGQKIQLVLTGRFWFEQYRGQERSVVEIKGEHGVPATIVATITQAEPFFAMVATWEGGAIRKQGALLAIVQEAAKRNRIIKFEFFDGQLAFGRNGSLTVMNGAVLRATDHNLQ